MHVIFLIKGVDKARLLICIKRSIVLNTTLTLWHSRSINGTTPCLLARTELVACRDTNRLVIIQIQIERHWEVLILLARYPLVKRDHLLAVTGICTV